MIKQFKSKEFLGFLLTGGIAAAVNFFSRIIYSQWTNFSVSIVLAYLTGMVAAFILIKLFVFKASQQSLHKSVIFFTLVNLVAVLQTWLVSIFLAYYLLPRIGVTSFSEEFAHAVGVIVPVFSSYLGHKRWTFR